MKKKTKQNKNKRNKQKRKARNIHFEQIRRRLAPADRQTDDRQRRCFFLSSLKPCSPHAFSSFKTFISVLARKIRDT